MIEKLNRHYSMTNPASVYDEEALTALELAARTTGKVNEMVDRVNELPQDVEKAVDKVLYEGTFDKLIDGKLDNLGSRFENLSGKLTEGSTTFDAEIVDARVDSSGHVYNNLGSAVRGVEAQTKREIDRFVSVNRLNPDTVISGYIHPVHGVITESVVYVTTDFIAIAEKETLGLFDKDMSPRQIRFVAAYDKNKELLDTMGATDVLTYTQSGDVGFVRLSYRNTDSAKNFMVCNADTVSFSEYGDGTLVNSVLPDNVKNLADDIAYTNRYHTADKVVGFYVNYLTGLLHENKEYFSTGFIRVYEGERLSLFNKEMSNVPIRMGAWFDRDGKYMHGFAVETTVISVPYGAWYVRFAVKNIHDGALMLAAPESQKFVERGSYAIRGSVGGGGVGGYEGPRKIVSYKSNRVEAGTTVTLDDFPKYLVNGWSMSFFARITEGVELTIGKGLPDAPEYGSLWAVINETGMTAHQHTTETVEVYNDAHSTTLRGFVYVNITSELNGTYKLQVATSKYAPEWGSGLVSALNFTIENASGVPFFKTNTTLENVSFSVMGRPFDFDVWVFGDSYMGNATNRVFGSMSDGYAINKILVDAKSGAGSVDAYNDLLVALKHGRPKTLVWYVGINDDFATYSRYVPIVKELCAVNNIDLVLNVIPSTPTLDRSQHREFARQAGVRLVDSWEAVGAVEGWATDNGNPLLSNDNTHPTNLGASVLAVRLMTDVPEIMGGYNVIE